MTAKKVPVMFVLVMSLLGKLLLKWKGMWMMMVEIKSGKRLEGNRTGGVLYPDLFVSSPTLFDKCFDYNDLQRILAK